MSSKKSEKIFESTKFTPEMMENELWDVLKKVRERKIKVSEANSIIGAAKEICNLARLRLQYRLLEGPEYPRIDGKYLK
jgi:chromosome condensin MukBEF complex kleisin-like MukF subunit